MTRQKVYNIIITVWYLLLANTTLAYTHADTLRGSNGNGRNWWDVQHYTLAISFDTATLSITGSNIISFKTGPVIGDTMQIDLQEPMVLDSVRANFTDKHIAFSREGNVYWLKIPKGVLKSESNTSMLSLYYHGSPRIAKNPPWDGGFIWKTDGNGKPWIAVACQGLGASVWWPCKDAQWDEPDNGIDITLYAPHGLQAISNGSSGRSNAAPRGGNEGTDWHVKNPINNYDVTFYIGDYVHWHDTLMGEKGKLELDYYVLRNNEEKARKQFAVVKQMLHCFEYWMGPYPFYEDGYKLVEAPYLGMEHQSAVAYGNKYLMGYLGRDRSNTGAGMAFDYIIVHESGHEWYGNNITAKDIADNWIHEGITTYSETLFAECLLGKEKAFAYCRGEWSNIRNDSPIIGDYGVNSEGSNDMYDKGAAIMHMIRVMMNDDNRFREMLHDMNHIYYHQTVTTKEIENFFNKYSGINLEPFFEQYLRTATIPELEYSIMKGKLGYRFTNVVKGFSLPLEVTDGDKKVNIRPTSEWQYADWGGGYNISVSKDFLVRVK